jgi:hypothetical protein
VSELEAEGERLRRVITELKHRATGFKVRGDTLFSGNIVAEELRHWADELNRRVRGAR